MAVVKKMTTDSEITATLSLMKQLRPHLMEDEYLTRIKRLQHNHGYNLVAVIEK